MSGSERSVAAAAGWYRRLLWIYPREFRRRFGDDLVELFIDLYRQSATASRARRAEFWMRIALDTIRSGLRERLASPARPRLRGSHRRGTTMPPIREDVRHAVGALRKQPGTAAAIVITLALAIGANSALFTVVNAVLLRPLPFPAPERLILLREVDPNGRDNGLSFTAFDELRESLTTISTLSFMSPQTVNLTGVSEPERLRGGFVTAGFFDMLGVQPIVGRGFAAGEDRPGAARTAVLAYRTWQQRFGGDPSVLGRPLLLNNEPHVVIGVTSPTFEFPIDDVDVWMPSSSNTIQDRQRTSRNWLVFGRLNDRVTEDAAATELRRKAAEWAAAYPDSNANWSLRFDRLHDVVVRSVRRNLELLFGAVLCVLLVACANIANLLLARAAAREREMAIRAALGASRARLVTQLLSESVVLALTGGILGLVGGALLTDSILTLLPNLPRAAQVGPDLRVVTFTAVISVGSAILFGLLPALRTSRPNLRGTLNDGARGSESRATGRLRACLVVSELAISLVLLVGAGLFTQSLTRLTNVDLGYAPENLLTLEYRLPRNKYPSADDQWTFHRQVLDRLAAVPGVQVAALAAAAPQSGNGSFLGLWRAEDSRPARDAMPRAHVNSVTDGFFRAMSIPVVSGRVCGPDDVPGETTTIMVNQYMAERMWPGDSAVGKRLRSADVPGEIVVVGVVGNTKPRFLSEPVAMQIYGCLRQQAGIFATVILKTRVPPMSIARSVQQAIWSVDPEQPMWKVRTAESMIANSVQYDRFVMRLMSGIAGLALLLAVLGTYSVLSHTVQRRAREVGVRVALGATRGSIVRLILRQTAILTASGLGIGLAGSLAMTRVVEGQLYDVSVRDPWTMLAATTTLAAAAFIAAWLPTHRATSIDPLLSLRADP